MDKRNEYQKTGSGDALVHSSRDVFSSKLPCAGVKTIYMKNGVPILIDVEDYAWASNYRWRAKTSGKNIYAGRDGKRVGGKRPFFLMHRVILGLKKGEMADHINGNGLDNRRCNLRKCTRTENARNQHARRGVSQYKGICRDRGKWYARIQVDGKRASLGRFSDEVEAAKAYNMAAIEHFDKFANLNRINA